MINDAQHITINFYFNLEGGYWLLIRSFTYSKQAQDQIPQTKDKIIIQKQQTAEDGQKLNRAIMMWNFIRGISELRDFRGRWRRVVVECDIKQ